MKGRHGQVALYLLAVLVALAVLVVMNVNVFLAVRAKNRAMNAGDAAALAAARRQGELLNEIGRDNVAHLKAAIDGDIEACARIVARQRRTCFLGPFGCLAVANEAAAANGLDSGEGGRRMAKILRDHVNDVRMSFVTASELYPEPWEGAWEEYALALEMQLNGFGDRLLAGPDNAEFADAWSAFPLQLKQFYNAIAGRNWCWFHFNGEQLLDCDSHNMPRPDFSATRAICDCELFPLHVTFRPLSSLGENLIPIVERLTGETLDPKALPTLLEDETQLYAFYDRRWTRWSTYPDILFNPASFPIAGSVRPEYDVYGCAAICRVSAEIPGVGEGDAGGRTEWTGAAKPFGTETDLTGALAPVTALGGLVTSAFTDVRLVPVDAVGGARLATADADWVAHVRDHLPDYYRGGPRANGCWYCQQLLLWEAASFRATGRAWLREHADTCRRSSPGSCASGGTPHGH